MSLKKKNKWLISILIIIITFMITGYNYVYKSHKTTEELATHFKGKSNDFILLVNKNSSDWINKTVELNGEITEKDALGVILNNSIYCQFIKTININDFKPNQSITIKGVVIGYDDLLEELKLNQCIIKN